MARKSKNSSSHNRKFQARRDTYPDITSRRLHSRSFYMDEIQDLRVSPHNSVFTPLLDLSGAPAPIKRRVAPNFQLISEIPKRALLCARRKIRKEVLFASGKGGSKVKPPKFNRNSDLRCK